MTVPLRFLHLETQGFLPARHCQMQLGRKFVGFGRRNLAFKDVMIAWKRFQRQCLVAIRAADNDDSFQTILMICHG